MRRALVGFALMFAALSRFAQTNGNLQIHLIDVGQGMGALLISPNGEKVLFDDGAATRSDYRDCL